MHASLLLWNDSLAHAYPNYVHLWRIEPDVMFSGNMSSLLARSARVTSDILLAHYVRRDWDRRVGQLRLHRHTGKAVKSRPKNATYCRWDTHEKMLEGYPPQVSGPGCPRVLKNSRYHQPIPAGGAVAPIGPRSTAGPVCRYCILASGSASPWA
jgi:hypothetical protein